MDVLLLEHTERYEGTDLLGIFSNDENGKAMAMKTGDKYVEREWSHLQYADAAVTLTKIRLNRPELNGRIIKRW